MRETRFQLESFLGTEATLGPLNLYKQEHFSLVSLILQVRRFMKEHETAFPRPLPMVVDHGIFKPGVTVEVPAWDDQLTQGRIAFRQSHSTTLLQIADFAAFCIGRCQWLLAKGSLERQEEVFLKIMSADRFNIVNLPKMSIRTDDSDAYYDRYL